MLLVGFPSKPNLSIHSSTQHRAENRARTVPRLPLMGGRLVFDVYKIKILNHLFQMRGGYNRIARAINQNECIIAKRIDDAWKAFGHIHNNLESIEIKWWLIASTCFGPPVMYIISYLCLGQRL